MSIWLVHSTYELIFNHCSTDYQKVVCDRAHSPVGQDDPDDDQVATGTDDDHDGEEHRP